MFFNRNNWQFGYWIISVLFSVIIKQRLTWKIWLFAKPSTIMPPNFVNVIPLNTELPIFVNASATLSTLVA